MRKNEFNDKDSIGFFLFKSKNNQCDIDIINTQLEYFGIIYMQQYKLLTGFKGKRFVRCENYTVALGRQQATVWLEGLAKYKKPVILKSYNISNSF